MSEDSFPFGLEQDSLANSLGAAIPNRSLMIVEGEIGGGKSLIAQRLAFGLVENGTKVALVTTELTTRGWLEQVASIGYGMSEYIDKGQFLLMSRFGVLTEEVEVEITIDDLISNEGIRAADFIIIDRASQLIPPGTKPTAFFFLQFVVLLLKVVHSCYVLTLMKLSQHLLREIKGSAEVVLGLLSTTQGGQLNRTLAVTRFLQLLVQYRLELDGE